MTDNDKYHKRLIKLFLCSNLDCPICRSIEGKRPTEEQNHDYYTRKHEQRCEILKPLGKLFVICAFGVVGFLISLGVVL